MAANDKQVDGKHYQRTPTQHWDWAQHKCYLVGASTKYLDRHDDPNGPEHKTGIKAVDKAVHYLQKLVERDYPEYELVFEVRRKQTNAEAIMKADMAQQQKLGMPLHPYANMERDMREAEKRKEEEKKREEEIWRRRQQFDGLVPQQPKSY